MTASIDMRWRAIVLTYVYGIEPGVVAAVLGVSARSISRWWTLFQRKGNVLPSTSDATLTKTRWPAPCLAFVDDFIKSHPCFYIEELQDAVKTHFPSLPNVSASTVCRVLRFDLGLIRKVLTKRARESIPGEIELFYEKLVPFYSSPQQLVFVDETAKDGRDVLRRHAWSGRNEPAIVSQPFARGALLQVGDTCSLHDCTDGCVCAYQQVIESQRSRQWTRPAL